MKIVPSLRLEDIQANWPEIEKLKKKIWGFSERAKQKTFERDLCFWDLMKEREEFGKVTSGEVVLKWNRIAPAGQKVKDSDAVKKAVKLIQTYIDRLTPIGG